MFSTDYCAVCVLLRAQNGHDAPGAPVMYWLKKNEPCKQFDNV